MELDTEPVLHPGRRGSLPLVLSIALASAANALNQADRNIVPIAVIPMAIPMTAGPGAISLMVVKASYQNPIEGQIAIILAVLLVCVVLWLFLKSATKISNVLGQTGMNIVTRIMGLLMLGVGVEFMAQGIGEMFPGLLAA